MCPKIRAASRTVQCVINSIQNLLLLLIHLKAIPVGSCFYLNAQESILPKAHTGLESDRCDRIRREAGHLKFQLYGNITDKVTTQHQLGAMVVMAFSYDTMPTFNPPAATSGPSNSIYMPLPSYRSSPMTNLVFLGRFLSRRVRVSRIVFEFLACITIQQRTSRRDPGVHLLFIIAVCAELIPYKMTRPVPPSAPTSYFHLPCNAIAQSVSC
jgi:hypothetical protein